MTSRRTTVRNHSELITNYFWDRKGEACQTLPYRFRFGHHRPCRTPVQEPSPLVNTLQLQHRYYSPSEIFQALSLPINIHELSPSAPSPWACSQVCLARSTFERPNLPCRPKPQCVCNFLILTAVSNYPSVQLRRKLVIVGDGMHVTVLPWTPSEEQNPQVLAARHHYFAPLLSENFPRNM